MPENAAVEAGVGGGDLVTAPKLAPPLEAQRTPRLTPVPTDGILRLCRIAAPASEPEPKPLLLTTVVTAIAEAAAAGGPVEADAQDGTGGWSGAALRRARERRGLTLGAVADSTRITRYHLENIEADRHDQLPSYVYLRGILLALAKELRLDGQQVCRSYLENARRATGDLN